MRYSPEGLHAFVQASALGSFSAAARKLGKRQSTVSMAIANLEADLGLQLFDRQGRQPALTEAGRKVLGYVQEILAAGERLDALSIRLAGNIEPRLTIVLSDAYQFNPDTAMLRDFEQRYPDIEFECMASEAGDVLDLLQSGRAHLGIVVSQPAYPPDIGVARLPKQAQMGLYVARDHPLARQKSITRAHLAAHRQLYLNTYIDSTRAPQGRVWSAPDYLMLLEMTGYGFGWAELPRGMVAQFSRGNLAELRLRGWPRPISMDAAWSKPKPPGPAGLWLLERLLQDGAAR
ncbi:LysR family transcriptional regulator [Bordetella sp. FB-8]|uniref:LysR family transcriptional regulator n=1 Tax=Bordetella sp. FB-8 TaxID=1159870 RepID=UPI0003760E6D|nr:LysR family transcriptional regulator [Bordetella sp. FB-8]